MTEAEGLKLLHVLSVIVWVGGGFMLQVLLARARKLGPDTMNHFTSAAEWTSNRIFMPASFAALITGVLLVIRLPEWNWDQRFISIGLTGFIISAIIGMAILGPTSKKLKELGPQRGPHDPVVTQLARRIDRAGKVDLIVLVAVVFVMVVKP